MNRPDEIRALGGLAGDALGETVRIVQDVHRAISDRVDAALPPPAKPISGIVRASTTATYATVRAAHRWIPRGAAVVTAARTQPDASSLMESDATRKAVATLNGIWGPTVTDRIAATTSLTLFHGDERVPLDTISHLAGAQPNLVVFVHGLVETEADWNRQPRGAAEPRIPYPELIEADLAVTSLALRYNSGHAVGTNGAELAELLEAVSSTWPLPLESITLVGHSMGGLVARSAAHQGHLAGQQWVRHLRLIVSLGTPHLGSPVSKAVDLAERALNLFPESAPIGRLLTPRSAGVRDLSDGRILNEQTTEQEPAAVPGVTHCSLGSTLTDSPNHPVALLIGDGLVRLPSASGRGRTRRLNFEVDTHLGGMDHFAMLNSPDVYTLVRGWIAQFALPGTQSAIADI